MTVIITTHNEAPNIVAALDSVADWATEIIVVDSYSDDGTWEILKNYGGLRLFRRHYAGPADQKNWAIRQASHEWILLMDADERATAALWAEIGYWLTVNGYWSSDAQPNTQNQSRESGLKTDYNCFWIGFEHYFMGQRVRFSGWQNDKTIRLIRRDKCRYNSNQVHEEILTEGLQVGALQEKFLHFTYRDIRHFVAKQARYAAWSAEDYETKTGKITLFHLIVKPIARFFKHYVLRFGFLDGRAGLFIAAIAAWTVRLRYVKILENRRLKS